MSKPFREELKGIGLAAFSMAILAACSPDEVLPTEPPEPSIPSAIASVQPTDIATVEAPLTDNDSDLDLREANVVDVQFTDQGDRMFRFDVTLYHDDDGEAPNYADWWLVEDPEGSELGKRILLHGHSTAPFTRSETIHVPEDVNMVIVRGHDMLHGYGGQSMRVLLETGELSPFNED